MSRSEPSDDMRHEYDFTCGVRGKHHEQYKAGTNVRFSTRMSPKSSRTPSR